jgi:hypothetical protein
MKRLIACAFALVLSSATICPAQSLDDLNIQIHGYATQGFLYTTQNNYLTTTSSNGSSQWSEVVVNVGATPTPKLRFSAQVRYELLGNLANGITLDYAAADYKANDKFGVRFGKVKIPSGLFNEIQDNDPSYQWGLLPQSVYPIASRNGQLTEFGGVAYGTLDLEKLGKLEYRGWGGQMDLPADDGYFLALRENGITIPNGLGAVTLGGALHWKTPLPGLMVGASLERRNKEDAQAVLGSYTGNFTVAALDQPNYFARYEKGKWMVAAEYTRLAGTASIQFVGLPAIPQLLDQRSQFAMATYKVTSKLSVGIYNSESINRKTPLGPARFSKDWAVSGRYDFNQFLYAKAEQHWIDGTSINYDATLNPNGLKPDTMLTILKAGVSF